MTTTSHCFQATDCPLGNWPPFNKCFCHKTFHPLHLLMCDMASWNVWKIRKWQNTYGTLASNSQMTMSLNSEVCFKRCLFLAVGILFILINSESSIAIRIEAGKKEIFFADTFGRVKCPPDDFRGIYRKGAKKSTERDHLFAWLESCMWLSQEDLPSLSIAFICMQWHHNISLTHSPIQSCLAAVVATVAKRLLLYSVAVRQLVDSL